MIYHFAEGTVSLSPALALCTHGALVPATRPGALYQLQGCLGMCIYEKCTRPLTWAFTKHSQLATCVAVSPDSSKPSLQQQETADV